MSDEDINLLFGIFIGAVISILFSASFFIHKGRVGMADQAVEKGYGEYVIEEKEIVFRWLDKSE